MEQKEILMKNIKTIEEIIDEGNEILEEHLTKVSIMFARIGNIKKEINKLQNKKKYLEEELDKINDDEKNMKI